MDEAYNHHHYILVFHPTDRSVLTCAENQLLAMDNDQALASPDQVSDYVKNQFHFTFDLILLRTECPVSQKYVWEGMHRSQYMPKLFIFEIPRDQVRNLPHGVFWTPQSEVRNIRLDPLVDAVRKYLKAYSTDWLDIHKDRLYSYSRPGWFDEATDWIRERLEGAGHEVVSFRQLVSGSTSCVLRATTTAGTKFYLKAMPSGEHMLNNEVAVTCALGEVMPQHFKAPMSFNMEKNWMLMSDHGPTFGWGECKFDKTPELARGILSAWAKVQKDSIHVTEQLAEAGVPVIDMKWIRKKVEKMVRDVEWFEAQRESMKEGEIQYSHSEYKDKCLAKVDVLFQKMSQYKVPLALVHGDLNPVNTISTAGIHASEGSRFEFIDFAETCISYPFQDFVRFRSVCNAKTEDLEFYLSFWTEYEQADDDPASGLEALVGVMTEVDSVLGSVRAYMDFCSAEEGERPMAREELYLSFF